MSSPIARSASLGRVLKNLSAVLLLLLYIGGNTQLGVLHGLFHKDDATNHTSVQEENPCHRSIYHGQNSGCKHEFHLVKVSTCLLCHTLCSVDQIIFNTTAKIAACNEARSFDLADQIFPDSIDNIFSSRGPPASIAS